LCTCYCFLWDLCQFLLHAPSKSPPLNPHTFWHFYTFPRLIICRQLLERVDDIFIIFFLFGLTPTGCRCIAVWLMPLYACWCVTIKMRIKWAGEGIEVIKVESESAKWGLTEHCEGCNWVIMRIAMWIEGFKG
jgi:hypothetical protein